MTGKNKYEVSAKFDDKRLIVGVAERGEAEGEFVVKLDPEFENANLVDVQIAGEPTSKKAEKP